MDRLLTHQRDDDRKMVFEVLGRCAGGPLDPGPADQVEAWTSSEWRAYLNEKVTAGALPADVVERVGSRVGGVIILMSAAAGLRAEDVIEGVLPAELQPGGDLYEAAYASAVASVFGEYLRHRTL